MTEAAQNGLMSDLTYNNAGDAKDDKPGFSNDITTKIPVGADKAIVLKFVRDPRGKQAYIPITYFKHMIGDSDKDTRYHPCRKSLGEAVSPELDRREELLSKLKALKTEATNAGQTKEVYTKSPEWVQVKEELDLYKPKRGGHILYVEPSSDQVKSLKISAAVINRLFGRKGTEWSEEIPSLLEEMQRQGKSPFISPDPAMNKFGWVKLWKTGEGLSTRYHLEPATVSQIKEIEGQRATITVDQEFSLHPRILSSDLSLADIPDGKEFERNFMFTAEEATEFVTSKGLKVPERFLKGNGGDNESDLKKATPETTAAPTENATEADLANVAPPSEADVEGDLPSF